MNKRIALVLCLLLACCLPAVASAADEAQFIGTWVTENFPEADAAYSITVIRIEEDNQAYFITQRFNPDELVGGNQFPTRWEPNEDGGIRIWIRGNVFFNYYIMKDGRMGEELFQNVYSPIYYKISDPTLAADAAPSRNLPDGIRVPQGEYTVGDLIPPGTYKVTLSNEDLAVIWVTKPKGLGSDYYSLVYSKGETEAVVLLSEGGTFRVQHSTVILSEFNGF